MNNLNDFLARILQRGTGWVNTGQRKPDGDNVAEIYIDFDNLVGYARDIRCTVDGGRWSKPRPLVLDEIIDWICDNSVRTGIDVISEVFVFRTAVQDYVPHFPIIIRDPSRFNTASEYVVPKYVRGYGDDEMYRLVAARLERGPGLDTAVFLSSDNGVGVAGQKLAMGLKPYEELRPVLLERLAKEYRLTDPENKDLVKRARSDLWLDIETREGPEVVIISALSGETGRKSEAFIENLAPIDLNMIVAELGYLPSTPYPA